MSEFTIVLLSWFVMFGPEQGKREAALATYKASGMQRSLDLYVARYPQGLREVVSNSFIIGTGIANRYLTYTWTF